MKYAYLAICLTASTTLFSQNIKPTSISVSYFGETITHPGIKLAAHYELDTWSKNRTRKNGKEKTIQSSVMVSPGLGFFYHKDYQTGIFLIPELSYTRKKNTGNFVAYGLGAGYMRTFIPNVYDIQSNGEIAEIHEGHNYFLTNYFVVLGKDLSITHEVPIDIYIKPQLMYAIPNTPNGVWYFALEIGVNYKLVKK